MPAKVGYLAINTIDPNSLASFWCGLPEAFRWRCIADPQGNEHDLDVLPTGS
jgi:hypothetical protein